MQAGLNRALQIAVVGAGQADAQILEMAHAVGDALARAGVVLICGGRGGVMAAASRGCRLAGGLAVGVLPGEDAQHSQPNDDLGLALFTAQGQGRNLTVVLSAAAVIAIGGGWGTLSEITLARKHGIPVVLLHSWKLDDAAQRGAETVGLERSSDAESAVALALELADRPRLGLI